MRQILWEHEKLLSRLRDTVSNIIGMLLTSSLSLLLAPIPTFRKIVTSTCRFSIAKLDSIRHRVGATREKVRHNIRIDVREVIHFLSFEDECELSFPDARDTLPYFSDVTFTCVFHCRLDLQVENSSRPLIWYTREKFKMSVTLILLNCQRNISLPSEWLYHLSWSFW